MSVTVSDVLNKLEENNIEYQLLTPASATLDFPVRIDEFNGAGLSFYNGNDPDVITAWEGTEGGLIICSSRLSDKVKNGPFLFVEKARRAFALSCYLFLSPPSHHIHSTAIIDPEAEIGSDVTIGPYCVIGKAKIDSNTTIGPHCIVKDNVEIGKNVNVFSNVNLGEPGLGSVLNGKGENTLFPHFDKLLIEDNVVIGSGTFIDKGCLFPTIIKESVHISKCCSIGHNSILGRNTNLSHGVHVGGSSVIGERCWLGIGVCIKDKISIADEVTIGMNATVNRSCLKNGTTLLGPPAKEYGTMFNVARIIENQS